MLNDARCPRKNDLSQTFALLLATCGALRAKLNPQVGVRNRAKALIKQFAPTEDQAGSNSSLRLQCHARPQEPVHCRAKEVDPCGP